MLLTTGVRSHNVSGMANKLHYFAWLCILSTGCLSPHLRPIEQAAYARNKPEIERLLQQGADINVTGRNGQTLLYDFAFEGDSEMVEFLLSKGADANIGASWKNGDTPLHKAAEKGQAKVVEVLLEHGVNVDIRNRSQATPLMCAAWNRQPETVRLLLQRGASVNAFDSSGDTALFMGRLNQPPSNENYRQVIGILFENHVKVNVRNHAGCTPLTMAARVGDVETVRLLLNAGADRSVKDVNGETAMMIAKRDGNYGLQKILAEHSKEN